MNEHVSRSYRSFFIAVSAALVSLSVICPARATTTTFKTTVFFERNDGQSDPSVLYLTHGLGYSLFLTSTGATIVLPGPLDNDHRSPPEAANFFSLSFVGSNPHPTISGVDPLPGHSNYFSGSDSKLWHTNIPQFAKVRYTNLYPGIDVLFYVRDGQLEYDIVAGPGANLRAIRVKETGTMPHLTPAGDVALSFGRRQFVLKKPRVYQSDDPQPRLIPTRYALRGDNLLFRIGPYDHSRPLTIDPALIFSTYLNSNCPGQGIRDEVTCTDWVSDIAADSSGVYIVGSTSANVFPGSTPAAGIAGATQTFILKLNPSGTGIVYASYLADGMGNSIAVDTMGFAYVAGAAFVTVSASPAFPLTSGVFSGVVPSGSLSQELPFAAKLSIDGSSLVYSTLLQQPGSSASASQQVVPSQIAVDGAGALYITGSANASGNSIWMPLPTTPGAFQTTPGSLFVMKLTPSASGLVYSTYLDPHENPAIGINTAGIAVDSNGDAFVTGSAYAGWPTTTGAYTQTIPGNARSAFLTELNPVGSALVYSTYFATLQSGNGVAVDPSGEAVIVGSGDPNLGQGMIAKFNATGTALVYSTTIPGTNTATAADSVALDSAGNAYVVGVTNDPVSFQSLLLEPIESYPAALPGSGIPAEEVALKLDTSGNLQWGTFLASSTQAPAQAFSRIATDPAGDAYILFGTAQDFPATPNTIGLGGPGLSMSLQADFLLKIAPSLGAPVPLVIPASASFGAENVGTSISLADVQLRNYGDAPVSATLSITGDFSETDDCSTPIPGGSKCDANVTFTPTATGTRNGTLTFAFGGAFPSQAVALSGTGTAPAVTLSATSLSFGTQASGTTSAAQQITVTNSGTSSLSITSVQTTAQFEATSTCGSPIAPNGTCTIQVTFAPTASGVQAGTLTIADNASNSPQTVSLSGNQPATFALTSSGGSSATSATVAPGQTAMYALNLTGSYGFSNAVAFTCTGAPANSTCTVSPNPATVSGTSAVSVTVSIVTQAASTSPGGNSHPRNPSGGTFHLIMFGFALWFFSLATTERHFRQACLGFAIVVLFGICVGCGGGSSSSTQPTAPTTPATPAGAYTITVTGTSGSLTQSMSLTLNVN